MRLVAEPGHDCGRDRRALRGARPLRTSCGCERPEVGTKHRGSRVAQSAERDGSLALHNMVAALLVPVTVFVDQQPFVVARDFLRPKPSLSQRVTSCENARTRIALSCSEA